MKIKKVILDNIRCFDHLEIDFTGDKGSKDWIVVLGDNGVGKSTLLRSIALGLTEESGASGLLDELVGDWIKRDAPKKAGYVLIELEAFPGCREKATIKTDFSIDQFKEVKVRQKVNPKEPKTFNWDDLFVCGYGASRSQNASQSFEEYIITDSIYTLFNYSSELQNPELIVRRLKTLEIDERKIYNKLEHILMLEEGAITMEFSGIKVTGPWGEKMPIGAISDGYRVVLSMFTDSFGWKGLSEGSKKKPDKEKVLDLEGIILIDELEQHLHPRWQKDIIGLLRKQFPKVQFIISTHSPLCVIGTTELKDEDCAIIALDRGEEGIKYDMASPPRGKRADQVLTSYLFDLYTSSDNSIKRDIERYSVLLGKKMNESEKSEVKLIEERLDDQLGSAETDLEKLIEKAVHKGLKDLTQKSVIKKAPEDFETRRQLRNLFES